MSWEPRPSLQVIYIPGHSPDHFCLYQPKQGWLFTGDVYAAAAIVLSGPIHVWQIIDSLDLASLDVKILFPGAVLHAYLLVGIVAQDQVPGRDRPTSADSAPARLEQPANTPAPIRCGNVDSLLYLGHFSGRNLVRSFIEDQPVNLL